MIRSFGSKASERLWHRESVPPIDPWGHAVALRKLRQIGYAESLDDLRLSSGNRLEPLKGGNAGQYSIRVNDQWRICFRTTDAEPKEMETIENH